MAEKLATPVFVVFWRKHVHMASAKTFRKYVTSLGATGFTEKWQHANRYITRAAAETVAKRVAVPQFGRGPFVVEETRPPPAPSPKHGTMGLFPQEPTPCP